VSAEALAPGCVLLMQVGAFMQVMDDDARALGVLAGLKLQMAGDVDDPVVVGGFPRSGLDAYVGKLARAGRSVAIALQDADRRRFRLRRRLPPPRAAATLSEQVRWYCTRLPDHVVLTQVGWRAQIALPLDRPLREDVVFLTRWPVNVHRRELPRLAWCLASCGVPVAWIGQTGRRLTQVAERRLVERWSPRPV
jgi:hypothetical protein